LGSLQMGALAERIGPPAAVALGGAATALAVAAAAWRVPELRRTAKQPPPTSTTSTNLASQQPPQAERDADRVGVAPQHEAVARSVHAQEFPHVAQVALDDAAPVDEQQLVSGPDAHIGTGASRHDIIHHHAAQARPSRDEPQPAHVVVAQGAAGDAGLDDDAAPRVIHDQAGPLEHGVADDPVDVRASEK